MKNKVRFSETEVKYWSYVIYNDNVYLCLVHANIHKNPKTIRMNRGFVEIFEKTLPNLLLEYEE